MRRLAMFLALFVCNACVYVTPRSTVLGQTAMLPDPGSASLGASAGLAWAHEGPYSGTGGSATDQVLLPNLQGSLSYGLSDLFAVNVRGDTAGLHPGLTVALLRGDFSLAAQPQVGIGYLHSGGGSSSTGSSGDYVVFTAGARVLASHSSGVFGGLGYAFEFVSLKSGSGSLSSESTYQEHQLLLGVGYEAAVGSLKLRPEISFMVIPARKVSSRGLDQSADVSFVLAPSLTVAYGK
jgi:hypothetical protein